VPLLESVRAQIENIGSNTLRISGVSQLNGGEFTIGPDYLEVVSFIGASVVTRGSIRLQGRPSIPGFDIDGFSTVRCKLETNGEDILVPEDQSFGY
jgi:UDP-N-acetylglucosamine 1-carboxyvinyltransferase